MFFIYINYIFNYLVVVGPVIFVEKY